jgi:hypothetical protein
MLRALFGPSKDEIWSQVARDIGGRYEDGGFWGGDALRYHAGEWEITLDTYTVSNGNQSTTYTRMRAPFVNHDGLYLKIYREGIFSGIGKALGFQDIQIGDSAFDSQYVIKGNHEDKIRQLFSEDEVQHLVMAQQYLYLTIKDDEGWFGADFPDGVDELYFQRTGVLKDPPQLRRLFDLFAVILNRLVFLDSAYETDPKVRL